MITRTHRTVRTPTATRLEFKWRRMALFLALLLLSTGAFEIRADELLQCATLSRFAERGNPVDLVWQNGFLYAADGRGLSVRDVRDPRHPITIATAETERPSTAVAVSGEYVGVTTAESVDLFRLTGHALEHLDSRKVPAQTNLAASGDWLISSGQALSLWHIVKDRLVLSDRISLSVPAALGFTGDGHLLVSGDGAGTREFGINGGRFVLLERMTASGTRLLVDGDTLYLASGWVTVVDLSATPHRMVTRIPDAQAHATALAVDQGELFVADGGSTISVFDVRDPSHPTGIGTLETPASTVAAGAGVLFSSGHLYDRWGQMGEPPYAVSLFALRPGITPELVTRIDNSGGPLAGVATDGRFAWFADHPCIRGFDLSRPTRPRELQCLPNPDGADELLHDPRGILAWGRGDVHIYDASDPSHLVEKGIYHSLGATREGATFFRDHFMIEDNVTSGLHLLDISDASQPRLVSYMKINGSGGEWVDVVATDFVAYGAAQGDLTKVVDLADPAHPEFVRPVAASGTRDTEIRNDDLLLTLGRSQLTLLDLSTPLDPTVASAVPIENGVDLAVDGDTTYVVTRDGKLIRIDISDPAHPRITHTASGLSDPHQVSVANGLVVVADRFSARALMDLAAADVPVVVTPTIEPAAGTSSRSVQVLWSDLGVPFYQVQTADQSSFIGAQTRQVDEPSLQMSLDHPIWIRVRGLRGCQAGPWSDAMELDPASFVRHRAVRR